VAQPHVAVLAQQTAYAARCVIVVNMEVLAIRRRFVADVTDTSRTREHLFVVALGNAMSVLQSEIPILFSDGCAVLTLAAAVDPSLVMSFGNLASAAMSSAKSFHQRMLIGR